MRNDQITYPVGSTDWMLLLARHESGTRIRPSPLAMFLGGVGRLLHLMVSEKSSSDPIASTADATMQHE
ncbi:RNA polymerase subunit sigma-24, partial [Rhizobium ruizarguesonis]